MRPRIGITTSYDDGTQALDRRYVAAVERAGGLPLPLPMLDTDAATEALVDHLDGLVVIGGPAVTEHVTGPLPDELDTLGDRRAASDRAWIERSWAAGLPILGICYGMQRLNALAGGTIYGDVEREHDGALTHSQKRGGTSHPVHVSPSSRLHSLLDRDTVTVNTRHLQAIACLGDGFSVAATAPDGVIEAIEHDDGTIFGVQFHPERMDNDMAPLFQWLVTAAPRPQSPRDILSQDFPLPVQFFTRP
ncbi:MAG: gamma-glutamyl-gamma-aminobutyrate hydrolase [Bacteroidetes bacterium SW_9_63_38]|nr:MAG: gamma-glutamyl-gamma-aminobutyrate hydrolase [Bacteroidetes bacterium SW_9_63_38]